MSINSVSKTLQAFILIEINAFEYSIIDTLVSSEPVGSTLGPCLLLSPSARPKVGPALLLSPSARPEVGPNVKNAYPSTII